MAMEPSRLNPPQPTQTIIGAEAAEQGKPLNASPSEIMGTFNANERINPAAGVIIDVKHLNFFYGKKQALYDLAIPLREHQVTALIGPSGCGKSTFLRTLNRMNDLIPNTRTEGEAIMSADGLLSIRFEEREERSYVIPVARNIIVQNGQKIQAGTPLTSGQRDPQDVLRILGRESVQLYLVKEVQRVYRNTGVYINDKHIEIIVRQMLRRVRIDEPGDTEMLPNDLVDRFVYADTNAHVLAEGGEPATAQTVLLGVTKASLNTDSFLAAASFQETTRVLTEAAIEAQTDHLVGLKENVIIGKLIPAGSGIAQRRRDQLARQQQANAARIAATPVVASVAVGSGVGANGLGITLDSQDNE